MSVIDTLADGRLALARNNIETALSDLGAVRARVAEGEWDDEWQEYVEKAFAEQERLLREALEALQ